MNKIPKTIYLQIGDECPDDIDFDKLTEVSWCIDRIFSNDIEYKLKSQLGKLFTELGELISEQQHTGDWQFNDNSDVRKFTEICNKVKELENGN